MIPVSREENAEDSLRLPHGQLPRNQFFFSPLVQASAPRTVRDLAASATLGKPLVREFLFYRCVPVSLETGRAVACVLRGSLAYRGFHALRWMLKPALVTPTGPNFVTRSQPFFQVVPSLPVSNIIAVREKVILVTLRCAMLDFFCAGEAHRRESVFRPRAHASTLTSPTLIP